MCKYSRDELWEFVWRANTPEKIAQAEKWLIKNLDDMDLFDDLMRQLAWQYNEKIWEK